MRKEKRGKTRLPAELGRKKKDCSFWAKVDWKRDTGTKKPKPISAFFAFPKILSFSYSAFVQEEFFPCFQGKCYFWLHQKYSIFSRDAYEKRGFFFDMAPYFSPLASWAIERWCHNSFFPSVSLSLRKTFLSLLFASSHKQLGKSPKKEPRESRGGGDVSQKKCGKNALPLLLPSFLLAKLANF